MGKWSVKMCTIRIKRNHCSNSNIASILNTKDGTLEAKSNTKVPWKTYSAAVPAKFYFFKNSGAFRKLSSMSKIHMQSKRPIQ